MKKVIIVDNDPVFRNGLKTVLNSITDIEEVVEVEDGLEFLSVLDTKTADVVFMDIKMPLMGGIEATRHARIKYPTLPIIGFSSYENEEYVNRMLDAGANGYLSKLCDNYESLARIMNNPNAENLPVLNNINLLNSKKMETKKIAIVDDDMDVINIIETILSKEGYTIVSANDKVEGMKLIKREKPDMAILDVMMTTHYEGFELAKEITDDPELSKMPILMQTSIDILTTTKPDVQAMAREFRKNPGFKDLHVILVKDIASGKAGVDYLSEKGQSIWFPVDGFVRKPVDAKRILPEIKKILG